MGKWAKIDFGRETFDSLGFVLAGTIHDDFEKKVLSLFDQVISSKDSVWHAHLVQKGKYVYPLVTNVYGAPAMMDILALLYDGGCRNVLFVGYAYGGFKNHLEVGSIVLPRCSYHFDGIYSPLDPSRTNSLPDRELRQRVKTLFNEKNLSYGEGPNISVPSVTFQLPHANEKYQKINPLTVEMELASCFSRAKDIGIRSAGVLIISDNRTTGLDDKRKSTLRREKKLQVIDCLVRSHQRFHLSALKTKRTFSIDEHLASIIEDPDDKRNVYKKS